jgi:hypothetical protein
MHPTVYRDLMRAYLDNKMLVDEFRLIYFAAVKNDKSVWVAAVSYPIQRVFSSLDAYWEEGTTLTSNCCRRHSERSPLGRSEPTRGLEFNQASRSRMPQAEYYFAQA